MSLIETLNDKGHSSSLPIIAAQLQSYRTGLDSNFARFKRRGVKVAQGPKGRLQPGSHALQSRQLGSLRGKACECSRYPSLSLNWWMNFWPMLEGKEKKRMLSRKPPPATAPHFLTPSLFQHPSLFALSLPLGSSVWDGNPN
jgi:hypothetical protein